MLCQIIKQAQDLLRKRKILHTRYPMFYMYGQQDIDTWPALEWTDKETVYMDALYLLAIQYALLYSIVSNKPYFKSNAKDGDSWFYVMGAYLKKIMKISCGAQDSVISLSSGAGGTVLITVPESAVSRSTAAPRLYASTDWHIDRTVRERCISVDANGQFIDTDAPIRKHVLDVLAAVPVAQIEEEIARMLQIKATSTNGKHIASLAQMLARGYDLESGAPRTVRGECTCYNIGDFVYHLARLYVLVMNWRAEISVAMTASDPVGVAINAYTFMPDIFYVEDDTANTIAAAQRDKIMSTMVTRMLHPPPPLPCVIAQETTMAPTSTDAADASDVIKFRLRHHRINHVAKLVEPHVYAFITGAQDIVAPTFAKPRAETLLEQMHSAESARGIMQRAPVDGGDMAFEFPLIATPAPDARVYFVVMYMRDGEGTAELEAHSHVLVRDLAREEGIARLAFAGPMDSSLRFSADRNDRATEKHFATVVDSALLINGAAVPVISSAEAAVSEYRLITNDHARDVAINQFIVDHKEAMLKQLSGAKTSIGRPLAYMNNPFDTLDLLAVVASARAAARRWPFPMRKVDEYIRFAVRAKNIAGGEDGFIAMLSGGDPTAAVRVREVVCASMIFAYTLKYRNDELQGRAVDQMGSARLVQNDDCEGFGELVFSYWYQLLKHPELSSASGVTPVTRALIGFLREHYMIGYTMVYVNYKSTNMHCVGMLIPRGERGNRKCAILIDTTSPSEGNIVSCATGPVVSSHEEVLLRMYDMIKHKSSMRTARPCHEFDGHVSDRVFYIGALSACVEDDNGVARYMTFIPDGAGADEMPDMGVPIEDMIMPERGRMDTWTMRELVPVSTETRAANDLYEQYAIPAPVHGAADAPIPAECSARLQEVREIINGLASEGALVEGTGIIMSNEWRACDAGKLRVLFGDVEFTKHIARASAEVMNTMPCVFVIVIALIIRK